MSKRISKRIIACLWTASTILGTLTQILKHGDIFGVLSLVAAAFLAGWWSVAYLVEANPLRAETPVRHETEETTDGQVFRVEHL